MTEGFDFKVEKEMLDLSDGGRVAIRRWGGAKRERIVMSHGNGLAIDGFYEFAKLLDEVCQAAGRGGSDGYSLEY